MIEPRWLSAREGADYTGMDTEAFRRAVRRGTLPAASYKLGKQSPRWDRIALDRAMGAEDAGADIGEAVSNVVEQIRREAEDQDRQKAARGRKLQNV